LKLTALIHRISWLLGQEDVAICFSESTSAYICRWISRASVAQRERLIQSVEK